MRLTFAVVPKGVFREPHVVEGHLVQVLERLLMMSEGDNDSCEKDCRNSVHSATGGSLIDIASELEAKLEAALYVMKASDFDPMGLQVSSIIESRLCSYAM